MFSQKHYVAVLRWRQGEVDALRNLYELDRKIITPLIELLPKKGGGFSKIIKDIGQNWGFDPFFLDLDRISPNLRLGGGGHPLILMGNAAKSMHLKLVPVTGLNRPKSYQAAVAVVARANKQGICVRVRGNEISKPNFGTGLLKLLSSHKKTPQETDLIVDLEVVDNSKVDYAALCAKIPKLRRWRTFTVLGGAFPENLMQFVKNSEPTIKRYDWCGWREETTNGQLARKPSYGDYTIQCPTYEPPTVDFLNPSASIRYTASDQWLIMRGEGVFNDNSAGFAQFPAQAMLLSEKPEFCGADYSFGDKYIKQVSGDWNHTGNFTTWICAGVNHHLTFVARQVANLP
jgi:hypothetical protein